MNIWTIITIIGILFVIGMGAYNIRSLIMKWQNDKSAWEDLAIGIFIWSFAIGTLVSFFFQELSQ